MSHSATAQSAPARPFCLSWTHYVFLLAIKNPDERSFYEIEAANESWTVRELKRQFDSSLYERLALSRDKVGIRKLAQKGQIVESIADVLKEPLVLEFLGLEEQPRFSENDLETAIIKNVSTFRPNGASQASPGQRPGNRTQITSKALQGRPNRCPNPLPACTSTSFSAPKTANPSSPTPSAMRCTPTWQSGYGAFAVSESNVETVRQYIANQREHHRTKTFQEEYRAFLKRHNVAFDERYVWD